MTKYERPGYYFFVSCGRELLLTIEAFLRRFEGELHCVALRAGYSFLLSFSLLFLFTLSLFGLRYIRSLGTAQDLWVSLHVFVHAQGEDGFQW